MQQWTTPMVTVLVAVLAITMIGISAGRHLDLEHPRVQDGIAAFEAGNFNLALQEFQPLADKNNSEAAYWLGRMYEDGLGVKTDIHAALKWYRRSAEAGWVPAELQLGEIYLQGTEELQDFEQARKWFDQAAHGGDARAQTDLGQLYADGWGTAKDPVSAYAWYELAASQGDERAQRLRDQLIRSMGEDEITAAQKLAQKLAGELASDNDRSSADAQDDSESTGAAGETGTSRTSNAPSKRATR